VRSYKIRLSGTPIHAPGFSSANSFRFVKKTFLYGRRNILGTLSDFFVQRHETIKNIAETLALAAAGTFFLVKLGMGFLIVDSDVSVATQRFRDPASGKGVMVVDVKIDRGTNGSLSLHRIRAKVTELGGIGQPKLVSFEGIGRLDPGKQDSWKLEEGHYIRLPPGESTHFSAPVTVDPGKAYEVEVSVQGKRLLGTSEAQWKATAVSVPPDWAYGGEAKKEDG
jgi:hypothetical protein